MVCPAAPKKDKKIKTKKKHKTQKNNKTNTVNSEKQVDLNMFSANADGLQGKTESLKQELKETDAAIFSIQETKFRKPGRLKIDKYTVFEAIRKNKEKGGTMLGVKETLNPVLIEEYSDTFELLVVEINVGENGIRVITGYGPQENWEISDKMPFFVALEEEITKAHVNNKSVIIELDANSKLGKKYVKNDPHEMSANGKILSGIIERKGLVVANSLEGKSSGLITRKRTTVNSVEESVIDFVLISNDLEEHMTKCHIDEEKNNVLTRIIKTKDGPKRKESDHNSIITSFKIEWTEIERKNTTEIFNFKDEDGMRKFKELTSDNKTLSSIFDTKKNVHKQSKMFLKRLQGILHQCFRKVKIKEITNKEADLLYKEQKHLKGKIDSDSKQRLAEVETKLAEIMSEDLHKIVNEEVKRIDCESASFHSGHLWKLKHKLKPKMNNQVNAVEDESGELKTNVKDIEEATIKHYSKVLENREIKESLKEYKKEREDLCNKRIEAAKENKTPKWTAKNVNNAINGLKKKKSRDPHGYSNELIQAGGEDLKLSIEKMMNKIKETHTFPHCLEPCNITSLFKNKGSSKDLNNYRGVFRVCVFRNILENLIYNDEYSNIDQNLTDSNVGGRKGRGIRDNLFVINAITNSVKHGSEEACDIQVYDIEKCFDSLWVQECINTLYEGGLRNDKLVLLYEETKNAQIAIKTSSGTSERKTISNIIMQGTVFGSLICTSVMDKLAKIFYSDPSLSYIYKGEVTVPVLGMVDDVLCVTKCSSATVITNSTINAFMELNKLKLSSKKCSKIHIGAKCDNCPDLKVHDSEMKQSQKEKYLGDFISDKGTVQATIEDRIAKAWSYVSEISALINEFPFGNKRIQVGLILREAMFLNGALYSSEAWHGVTEAQVSQIELVDNQLLRKILNAHAKTPVEFLYLESGALPVRFVISSKRLNYLNHIHKIKEHELLKRVFYAQKKNPSKGDWYKLVQDDLDQFNIKESVLAIQTKQEAKRYIKQKVYMEALKYLKDKQSKHKKIEHLYYKALEVQDYIKSKKVNDKEAVTLVALRSKTVRQIKENFHAHYTDDNMCPLCDKFEDTQKHCMECEKLGTVKSKFSEHIQYSHINGNVEQQQEVAALYVALLEAREGILQDSSLPGTFNTGPGDVL